MDFPNKLVENAFYIFITSDIVLGTLFKWKIRYLLFKKYIYKKFNCEKKVRLLMRSGNLPQSANVRHDVIIDTNFIQQYFQ